MMHTGCSESRLPCTLPTVIMTQHSVPSSQESGLPTFLFVGRREGRRGKRVGCGNLLLAEAAVLANPVRRAARTLDMANLTSYIRDAAKAEC